MKNLLILTLILLAINSYGQSKTEKTKGVNLEPQKIEGKKDDTIPVEYVHYRPRSSTSALFVNGEFLPKAIQKINPNLIKRISIIKIDTTINGRFFDNRLYIELKGKLPKELKEELKEKDAEPDPRWMALKTLVDRYTRLKGKAVVITIDDRLINDDYSRYQVDKNTIFKIFVQPFGNTKDTNEIWLVKILTKTKENMERSKHIILRGNTAYAEVN